MKVVFLVFWVDLLLGALAFWHLVILGAKKVFGGDFYFGTPKYSFAVLVVSVIVCLLISKTTDKGETAHPPTGG